MIQLSQTELARLLISSLAAGALLGAIYDAMRFFLLLMGIDRADGGGGAYSRLKRAVSVCITFVSDVAFMLVFAAVSLILTYNLSGGVFRGMVYVALAAGFAAYYFTLGRIVLRISCKLARFLRVLALKIAKFALKPIKAIFSVLIGLYHLTIGKVIGKIKERAKERSERAKTNAAPPHARALIEGGKEEIDRDVTKHRYKREGRISFAGRRER